MDYEIDFIGVSKDKSSTNADAICFRWATSNGYKIAVYDVGLKAHGEALVNHLNKYYFDDVENRLDRYEKKIDYLFISHPHQDHVMGIDSIIENFDVGTIYMNRPWLYREELETLYSNDGRATPNSIGNELYIDFSLIKHIEELADDYGIKIHEAFQGLSVENRLHVLSPSKAFYLHKIAASTKTDRLDGEMALTESVVAATRSNEVVETWNKETIREGESTDAENETSIVLLGDMDEERFLLTGDAGNEALRESIDYEYYLSDIVYLYEVPHHGGRHNVSPSLLNDLLGPILAEGRTTKHIAVASVAEGSDHPKKMVVNAFTRRGVKVYTTAGSTFWHHYGDMPERKEFITAEQLPFYKYVESWDD